ncbi:NFYB/HAP3 family transcription factor subunit [Candidatus Woesearchaeota archaeon]|nr:NFYB/HAP3 family transcription factor subunit [Candidatus Woesearchaeota archaeon]
MAKHILPLAAMESLLKTRANAPRVGNSAKEALRDILEEIGEQIGQKAVRLAHHSGRKTVKSDDIKIAYK